ALDYAYYLQYVKDDPLVAYQNLDLGENSVFNELTPPNENFAREWLELASMSPDNRSGQANYTPFDIAELALALSGRGYDTDEIPIGGGEFVEVENPVIKPAGFVPGPKTLFFGQPFETTIVDADDAADAILSHPETYTHMAEELLSNYLTPAPSNAAVQFIADQIQNDGGKLHNAFRKMMLSEELYSADNEKILPKSPMDILIGFLRKTGLKVNHRSLEDRLDDLGHSLGKPGNNQAGRIFGWKMLQLAGEGYVISRRNVVNRFMNDLRNSSYRENWGVDIYDLFVKDLPDGKPASEALVDSLVELLGVRINSAQKAQLIRYLDYNWENCDSYEVAEYGCTEGEKFAKREAFDPSPDAPSWLLEDKVLGLLAVLLTLDEFYLR
ncbi:MAG: DUF1800 family protein, partial [Bdellovibrionales bacterium]|nr:DUF1800 family protein [Bdellovibrionales bacterium]